MVTLLRYVAIHDSGRLINPMIVEGQVHGGIVHGIGNALFERMRYDEAGQPLSTTFSDYLLPASTDVSPPRDHVHGKPDPGESAWRQGRRRSRHGSVTAAIASAVDDALSEYGVFVAAMPLDPVRVVQLIGDEP